MITFRFNVSALLLCLVLVGCGGSEMPGSDESQQVIAVVSGVNDAAGDESTFATIFVGGNAPEERSKFYSSKIEVVETPSVSGDEASVVVKISQGASEGEGRGTEKNEEVNDGQVTWKLKKEGTEWKLVEAPLP